MIHWDKIYICTVRKYKGFNDFFLYSHEIIDIWLKWQTDEAENFLVTEAESSMVISVSSAPDTEHCQYPCTILSTNHTIDGCYPSNGADEEMVDTM